MALVVKDRVRETTTTTGTGTLTLAGVVAGFQSFSAIGDGNTTYYAIIDQANDTWEVGLGTYTATGTTLSRDTILESSNGGTAVNFAAGSKDVFCTQPAEKAVYLDSIDEPVFPNPLLIASGGTSSTTAAGARTALGLEIGTDVQAWDTDLDTYAANPLTSAELTQLQNIDTTTVSIAQWGYLGAMNQGVATTDSVSFAGITGPLTGNADTATALETGRTISLTGDVTGTSAAFDGTGNVSITATVTDDSHNHIIGNVDGLQTALDGKAELSGDTFTGLLITDASDATAAGIRLPHGVAPTTPTNGDLWTTTAGLYARINGATVGPYSDTVGTVTSVGTTGTVNGLTLTGTVTSSGNLTLGGTLAINNDDWSGTDLAIANGGTGASDAGTALTNLGAQAQDAYLDDIAAIANPTGDQILFIDDTDNTVKALAVGTGLTISGTTISADNNGTVTSVGTTGSVNGITLTGTVTTSGNLTLGGTLAISNADWSGTDLAVANGGTGASDAPTARTNLGLDIGSDVQAWDAYLDDIAAISNPAGDQILFIDDTDNTVKSLAVGTGLTISGTTLNADNNGTVTSVGTTGSVNGITLTGTVTSSGNLTLGGTLAINNSDWSGTDLAIVNGGTGASDAPTARSNLGLGSAATSASTDFVAVTGDSMTGGLNLNIGNNITLRVGADNSGTSITNATQKNARIGMPHYTNAEEPAGVLHSFSTSTTNVLQFGGGSALLNAATEIGFYMAANNTTTTGTRYFRMTPSSLAAENGAIFSGDLTGDVTGTVSGNAGSATVLQTARTINGTSFNGSANITTANWGTSRTLTIGGTGKAVNGSGNVSWTLGEIGAQAQDAFLDDIAALTDPAADRILFFDNTDNTIKFLTAGTGLTISGTSINADNNGTVTSVGTTGSVNGITLTGTVTTSGNLTLGGTLAISNADWSGTDLAVANGGTGASTASGARTNLGLVIGTNVQAYDADLTTYGSNPLTAAELQQLQNIGATTISSTQWGYLGVMNQNVRTTDAVTFATVNTGQGATEVYNMNQNVRTTDTVSFADIASTGYLREQQYSLTGTAINPANGTIQYKTLSANTTFTESLSNGDTVLLMIDDGTAYTITWPTITWLSGSGSAPTLQTTGYTAITLFQMNGVLYGYASNGA